MHLEPVRFIGEQIEVIFDTPPFLEKAPPCPDAFIWQGETFSVIALLSERRDYERRGRMGRNMRPTHAATASMRGSRGVGKFHFRVRVAGGRIFDLYYDREIKSVDDKKGNWFLYREVG
jgi:hypothetical protein